MASESWIQILNDGTERLPVAGIRHLRGHNARTFPDALPFRFGAKMKMVEYLLQNPDILIRNLFGHIAAFNIGDGGKQG